MNIPVNSRKSDGIVYWAEGLATHLRRGALTLPVFFAAVTWGWVSVQLAADDSPSSVPGQSLRQTRAQLVSWTVGQAPTSRIQAPHASAIQLLNLSDGLASNSLGGNPPNSSAGQPPNSSGGEPPVLLAKEPLNPAARQPSYRIYRTAEQPQHGDGTESRGRAGTQAPNRTAGQGIGDAQPPAGPTEGDNLPENLKSGDISKVIDETIPLYEQAPFDIVTLDSANNNAVLKVSPLALPDRKVPQPLPRTGFLELELFDRPGERYRVPWKNVTDVKLFENLLIEKAQQLINEKKFDEAYDYIDYLIQNYPRVAGLEELQEAFLWAEADAAIQNQDFFRGFTNLTNLFRSNPRFPGLAEKLGTAADELVKRNVQANQYREARGVISALAQLIPDHPLVAQWRKVWQGQAEQLRGQIESALSAGKFREADRLLRQLREIWPELPDLPDLSQRVQQAYPRVRVAITLPAVSLDPTSLADWAARRTGKLVWDPLLEYVGPSGEGGLYRSRVVEWEREELGQRLVFRLRPDRRPLDASDTTYSGFDLAQQLLGVADSHNPAYNPIWAECLSRVRLAGPDEVVAEFRHPHLRPESLLRLIPTSIWTRTGLGSADLPQGNGAFLHSRQDSSEASSASDSVEHASGASSVLVRKPSRESAPGKIAEVEEVPFARGRDAIRALQQGSVDAIDRVNPWEISLLEKNPKVVVDSYKVPLVHLLLPNFSRVLPANRDFRRALLYGTNREQILNGLLGDREVIGCRVVSGPIPAGRRFDDPLGYGYDGQIEPRPYQPALALALAELAYRQSVEVAKKRDLPVPARGELTLAHPPQEIARQACTLIQRQWRVIGWNVKLVEIHPGEQAKLPPDYDFVYVEAAIWEPISDLPRLLQPFRNSEFFPDAVESNLATLGQAVDWPDAAGRLRTLHRQIAADVTVIPLWQLLDFYAYNKQLSGLGNQPVTLYQQIEEWNLQPQ